MSNQALQLIQNRLGLQQLVCLAIALDFQTNGAAAQGVDSRQAAQDPVSYTHLTLPTTPYV